jgi:hypothetical protein
MQFLSYPGVFFAGPGILLLSFGLFWWVWLYARAKGLEDKEKK